jgi:hypothetical protein
MKIKALSIFIAIACQALVFPPYLATAAKLVTTKAKAKPAKPTKHNLQQPYNPSKLQWLVEVHLSKDSVCHGTAQVPVASYWWGKPGQNDTKLTLHISAENKNQLHSCTFTAFEELRNGAFEMNVNPPKIKVAHYLTDKQGITNRGRKIYECYIPKQLKDHRKNVNYDTAYDLGRLTKFCK